MIWVYGLLICHLRAVVSCSLALKRCVVVPHSFLLCEMNREQNENYGKNMDCVAGRCDTYPPTKISNLVRVVLRLAISLWDALVACVHTPIFSK